MFTFYIPLIILYYVLKLPNLLNNKIRLNRDVIIISFMSILFILTIFGFGISLNRLTLEHPIRSMFVILFYFLVGGFAFSQQMLNKKMELLKYFLMGFFTMGITIVIFSFLTNPASYGYGKLISPFSDEEFNSPGISNSLALTSSYFLLSIFVQKNTMAWKIISLCIVVLSFLGAIYTSGRAFFVIFILTYTTLLVYLVKLNFKKALFLIFISIFMIIITNYSIKNLDYFDKRFELTLMRIELEGLSSERFSLAVDGIEKSVYYPFGGFMVNTLICNTLWFHNIFLDSARVAGLFPVFILLIIFLFTFKFLFYKSKEGDILPVWSFMITFLLMQQDVIIEGNYKIFFVFYLSCIALLDSGKRSYEKSMQWKESNIKKDT